MIRSDAGRCPVSAQCGILGVAKSTCYWVLEHPEAERADPYDVLLQCLFDRFGSVFPQCGLMVFPGVVIVSR